MAVKKPDNDTVKSAHDYGIVIAQRELFVGGELVAEGDEGLAFVKNLRILQAASDQPITVHLYSIGGDWCCGIVIRDAIATSTSPILLICHGIVASMGTVITTGCHRQGDSLRVNMPSCDWLIHEGYSEFDGLTFRAAQSTAEWEERIREEMLASYVDAVADGEYFSDMGPTKIKNYLNKRMQEKHDWWLTSEDALYYGFVDGILGSDDFETVGDILRRM